MPTFTVVRCHLCGYDAVDSANFLFQYLGPQDKVYLPPHDHGDNYSGGFAFACYHPGTSLPQQPSAQRRFAVTGYSTKLCHPPIGNPVECVATDFHQRQMSV